VIVHEDRRIASRARIAFARPVKGNGEVTLRGDRARVLGVHAGWSSWRLFVALDVVEDDDDLVGVLFRVVKSQAADREIDNVMIVPRSRPA
jgi:hypothetical protein